MTKDKLFDIMQYLFDHVEFYAELRSDGETLKYCSELRRSIFGDDNHLRFDVVSQTSEKNSDESN